MLNIIKRRIDGEAPVAQRKRVLLAASVLGSKLGDFLSCLHRQKIGRCERITRDAPGKCREPFHSSHLFASGLCRGINDSLPFEGPLIRVGASFGEWRRVTTRQVMEVRDDDVGRESPYRSEPRDPARDSPLDWTTWFASGAATARRSTWWTPS